MADFGPSGTPSWLTGPGIRATQPGIVQISREQVAWLIAHREHGEDGHITIADDGTTTIHASDGQQWPLHLVADPPIPLRQHAIRYATPVALVISGAGMATMITQGAGILPTAVVAVLLAAVLWTATRPGSTA